MEKITKKLIYSALLGGLILTSPVVAVAVPNNGAWTNATHSNINPNNFHTDTWDRFMPPNYQFDSGSNYRHVLGNPTYAHNFTRDTTWANIRRDAQGSHLPPGHRIFSGNIPTDRVNTHIPLQPQGQAWEIANPHIIPSFDSTGQGVNAPQNATPMFQGQGQGGFLQPTSIN
jgi:hypothetical protein